MTEPLKEVVIEYGEDNGVFFVICAVGAYPNIVRRRYIGDAITVFHRKQIDELEKEKHLKKEFEDFKKSYDVLDVTPQTDVAQEEDLLFPKITPVNLEVK